MMCLTVPNRVNLVQKQYVYKLKAYSSLLLALVTTQIVALLFSLGGTGMMSSGSGELELAVQSYSGNVIIIFTMIWALFIGILLNTEPYRKGDFTFVSTRTTSHLSNVALLMTASLVGGATAMLSSLLLKVIVYFLSGSPYVIGTAMTLPEMLTGWIATSLYVLLLSTLGYFVGMLFQWHRGFPVLLFALFLVGPVIFGFPDEISGLFRFFTSESTLGWFVGKVVLVAGVLFVASRGIFQRLEVR